MKVWFKRLALAAVTGVICLGVAEVAYRAHLRRSHRAEVRDLATRGGPWVPWPRSKTGCVPGYGLRPGFTHKGEGGGWSFTVNARGFRGRAPGKTGAGVRRVLALGDSFTFGWGVSGAEAYPARLEALLAAANREAVVFNAGVPGYNTAQEACLLERLMGEAVPDVVLLGYVVNDAEPQHTVPAHPDEVHRHVSLWLLERAREAVNRLGSAKDPIFRLDYNRHSLDYMAGFRAESPKWRGSRAALGRMARLCRQRKVPLLVFMLPDLDEHFDESYRPATIHAQVRRWCKELGLPFYDLLERLRGEDHKRYRLQQGHPNARGHEAIATYMAEVLGRAWATKGGSRGK